MEYYNLTLESRSNYTSSYYTDSLITIISEYYSLTKEHSSKIVKESLNETKTPIELLNRIKNSLQ